MAELRRKLTWQELMGWCAYFEHINQPANTGKAGGNRNLLDNPDAMVLALTGGK